MAQQAIVGNFAPADAFFRRIGKRSLVDENGLVHGLAFKLRDGEDSLSLTYQNESLKHNMAIDEYQRNKALPTSGDLPGICMLTYRDLTESLHPPRPPMLDPDESDPKYGHLHCTIDPPEDEIHMEMMAKLATQHGLIRPFVKNRTAR